MQPLSSYNDPTNLHAQPRLQSANTGDQKIDLPVGKNKKKRNYHVSFSASESESILPCDPVNIYLCHSPFCPPLPLIFIISIILNNNNMALSMFLHSVFIAYKCVYIGYGSDG